MQIRRLHIWQSSIKSSLDHWNSFKLFSKRRHPIVCTTSRQRFASNVPLRNIFGHLLKDNFLTKQSEAN